MTGKRRDSVITASTTRAEAGVQGTTPAEFRRRLLEGMAAGAPAITTRVGAIPDVVTEGVHGLFVPSRDSESIARAIGRLAADRDLLARMSAACRRRIASRYSMERLSGEVRRLYSEMCAGKRIKVLTRP